MGNIIVTYDINEAGKYPVVSEDCSWSANFKKVTVSNDTLNKPKKSPSKNVEMAVGLNTIEIEMKNAEEVPDFIFQSQDITSCIIPDGVKTIGHNAFSDCKHLQKLVIPASVERIDALKPEVWAVTEFTGKRKSLPTEIFKWHYDKIVIPEGVTTLKTMTFDYCTIRELVLPSTLKEIEQNAFDNATLYHFEWPEGVKVTDQNLKLIGDGEAYSSLPMPECPDTLLIDTDSIKSDTLIIPANVKKIEFEDSYSKIHGLSHIYVDPANKVYDSRENCNAVIETKTGKMIIAGAMTTVPEGVTEITDTADGICTHRPCPVMPSTLKKIGFNLRYFSEILVTDIMVKAMQDENGTWNIFDISDKITVDEGIKELPVGIFHGGNPNNVYLPDSLEVLNDLFTFHRYEHSEKYNLTIPAGVKEIKMYDFQDIKAITCLAPVAPKINTEGKWLCVSAVTKVTYPKGADYSEWKKLFPKWKFREK